MRQNLVVGDYAAGVGLVAEAYGRRRKKLLDRQGRFTSAQPRLRIWFEAWLLWVSIVDGVPLVFAVAVVVRDGQRLSVQLNFEAGTNEPKCLPVGDRGFVTSVTGPLGWTKDCRNVAFPCHSP